MASSLCSLGEKGSTTGGGREHGKSQEGQTNMHSKQEGLVWFSFVADESAPQTRSVTLTRTVQEALLVFSCWPNAVSLSIMNSVNQKHCQSSIWHWQIGQHCSICLLRQYAFSKMKSCFLVRKIPHYCSTKTGNNSLDFSSMSSLRVQRSLLHCISVISVALLWRPKQVLSYLFWRKESSGTFCWVDPLHVDVS